MKVSGYRLSSNYILLLFRPVTDRFYLWLSVIAKMIIYFFKRQEQGPSCVGP